jgi:hypothetical protein
VFELWLPAPDGPCLAYRDTLNIPKQQVSGDRFKPGYGLLDSIFLLDVPLPERTAGSELPW